MDYVKHLKNEIATEKAKKGKISTSTNKIINEAEKTND